MAIKLKRLEEVAKTYTEQEYVFKDLFLDLSKTSYLKPGTLLPVPGTDIKASFDLAAIRNSLQNLFNTLPGQRFLFPEYGLNIHQFLFLPVTDATGRIIAERLIKTIEKFEPRVKVERVNVRPEPDESSYYITLVISIPIFQQQSTIETQLNIKTQSFIFLPTSNYTR
jgi:phage baseplate assembly protein W